jgi:hypothetical protein
LQEQSGRHDVTRIDGSKPRLTASLSDNAPVNDAGFAASLTDAVDAGNVAAVLVRLPNADEHVSD